MSSFILTTVNPSTSEPRARRSWSPLLPLLVASGLGLLPELARAADTFGAEAKWNDLIAEIGTAGNVSLADVNGDGRSDAITFYRDAWGTADPRGDVMVSLSNGSSFGTPTRWHGWMCIGSEVCATGDFNGDGRADVAAFTQGSAADVWVATSSGSNFSASSMWHGYFAPTGELPVVGDINGDGKDDIVTYTRGSTNDVYIALSTGTTFGTSALWHGSFCYTGESCFLGDVNGDHRADLVAVTRGAAVDMYVSLSTGAGFGTRTKYHDSVCLGSEACTLGDANGDGQADLVAFTRGTTRQAKVALARGDDFGANVMWRSGFCDNNQTCLVADIDGDGDGDAVRFVHSTSTAQRGDVYVAKSSATRSRSWEIDLDKLKVVSADEDDFWSDGDEPYLMVFGFRTQVGVPGSSQCWYGGALYELDDGMYDGQTVTIPDNMGKVSFAPIGRGSVSQFGGVTIPTTGPVIMGAVVVAMESDASGWSFMDDVVAANIESAIEWALIDNVESGSILSFATDPDLITDTIDDVRAQMDVDIWDVLLHDGPGGWVDADDNIDVSALVYVATHPDVPIDTTIVQDDLDAGILRERAFRFTGHPLDFSGNGSHFTVEGYVRAL